MGSLYVSLFKQESSEESSSEEEGAKPTRGKGAEVKNMPFDEALELSASQSQMDAGEAKRGEGVKNMPFDEALEVSASMSHAAGASEAQVRSCCFWPLTNAYTHHALLGIC
jgi:hypothetical protein